MSDLLTIGRSGVLAYQGALQTIGENVTNSDTAGYARRSVVLTEQTSNTGPLMLNRSGSAFGGVQASQVRRVWDQYKAANAWTANADAGGASTRAQYLSTMETLLNDGDNGVGTRLTAIFTSASRLAASPADRGLRQAFVGAVSDAATTLNRTAENLGKLAGTIKTQGTVLVAQANDTLAALAKINLALHSVPAGTVSRAQIEDQRDSLLGTLSGAVAVDTDFAADGSVTLRLNNGEGPLLLDPRSTIASSVALQTGSDGRLSISIRDATHTVAATPTGGALAGLIDGAATNAGRRQQLDGLATGLKTLLNDFQTAGRTDAGIAGPALLSGTDAASIAIATSDVADLALASAGGVANGNLLDLAGTRGSDGVEARWKAMVTDQALLVSSANTEKSAASTRKDGAYVALDETTGIDLDNEAAELLRYQQAYSASAKIIQAARETLQSILDLF